MFSVDFEKLAHVLRQDVNSYDRLHLLRLQVSRRTYLMTVYNVEVSNSKLAILLLGNY